MKLRVGDKVKFLNENGGGTVTKVVDSKIVHVEIEDGFDIPTMVSELVKVDDAGQAVVNTVEEPVHSFETRKEQPETGLAFEGRKSGLSVFTSVKSDEEGVYLAFAPQDQQWLLTGQLDVYLINNTAYNIQYQLFLPEEGKVFILRDHDDLGAERKVLIDSIDREELEKWQHGFVQILFAQSESHELLLPANVEFKVKGSRFYKEGNYRGSNMIHDKALILDVVMTKKHQRVAVMKELTEGADQDGSSKAAMSLEPALIDKHRVSPGEAEVDLHIGEIVDNIMGMDNKAMLKTQMDYFHQTLTSAMEAEYQKVTFIHGVGNGVLKNAIMEALKDYEGLENKSASMAKFGVGAIDVIITYQ